MKRMFGVLLVIIVLYALIPIALSQSIRAQGVPLGWSEPQQVTDWIGHPDIAADNSGNLFVVSDCDGGTPPEVGQYFYFITKPAGGAWSIPQAIIDSAEDAHIAVDGNGIVHVVWQGTVDGVTNILYSARGTDGLWSSPLQISTGFGSKWSPAIAVDGENTVHVVWVWQTGTQIFYTYKPDGEDWTTPVSIYSITHDCEHPDIAADDEGNLIVVWLETELEPYALRYTAKNVGEPWSEPLTLEASYPVITGSPTVITNPEGNIHVVWAGYYSKMAMGGAWSAPVGIGEDLRAAPWDIAIDCEGVIHVVGLRDAVLYETHSSDGLEWSPAVRIGPEDGTWSSDKSLSMATDGAGNLHMVWWRIADYGIWYMSYGCAISPPPAVPTMTLWGGIAMAAILGLLVVYMVRRRQTALGRWG
jgi:hypothetical protein